MSVCEMHLRVLALLSLFSFSILPIIFPKDVQHFIMQSLQGFNNLTPWMIQTSVLSDPASTFSVVVPVILWIFDARLGAKLLLAVVSADCLNGVLKMPLQGDRPYWKYPDLLQVTITCETGYGMPSGHVMVSAAVWWLIARSLNHAVAYILVAIALALVAFSRVHISAHFPDQVASGLVCGITLATAIEIAWPKLHNWLIVTPRSLRIRSWAIVGVLTTLALVAQYLCISLFADPFHSVSLARAGCRVPGGIHSTTSPLTGILRDAGVYCGAGFGLCYFPAIRLTWPPRPQKIIAVGVFRAVIGVVGLKAVGRAMGVFKPPPSQELNLQNGIYAFFSFAMFGLCIVLVFPVIFRTIENVVFKRQPATQHTYAAIPTSPPSSE